MKLFSSFSLMVFMLMVAALLIVPMAFAAPTTSLEGSPVLSVVDKVAPEVVTAGYSILQVARAECLNLKGTSGLASAVTLYDMEKGATFAAGFLGVIQAFAKPSVLMSVL